VIETEAVAAKIGTTPHSALGTGRVAQVGQLDDQLTWGSATAHSAKGGKKPHFNPKS
jgi:hypothetical protein